MKIVIVGGGRDKSTNKLKEGIVKLKLSLANKEILSTVILNLQNLKGVFSIERMMK